MTHFVFEFYRRHDSVVPTGENPIILKAEFDSVDREAGTGLPGFMPNVGWCPTTDSARNCFDRFKAGVLERIDGEIQDRQRWRQQLAACSLSERSANYLDMKART